MCAYLAVMVNRLFLTLLALLTGLSAQIAPAHARADVSRGAEMGAVAPIVAARPLRLAPVAARQTAGTAERTEAQVRAGSSLPLPRAPDVIVKVDRAHE